MNSEYVRNTNRNINSFYSDLIFATLLQTTWNIHWGSDINFITKNQYLLRPDTIPQTPILSKTLFISSTNFNLEYLYGIHVRWLPWAVVAGWICHAIYISRRWIVNSGRLSASFVILLLFCIKSISFFLVIYLDLVDIICLIIFFVNYSQAL